MERSGGGGEGNWRDGIAAAWGPRLEVSEGGEDDDDGPKDCDELWRSWHSWIGSMRRGRESVGPWTERRDLATDGREGRMARGSAWYICVVGFGRVQMEDILFHLLRVKRVGPKVQIRWERKLVYYAGQET